MDNKVKKFSDVAMMEDKTNEKIKEIRKKLN